MKKLWRKKDYFGIVLILICVTLFAGCLPEQPVEGAKAGGSQEDESHNFPNRPITIYVGSSVGGSVDISSRAIQSYLQKILGVPITVTNLPGAGHTQSRNFVWSQPADGYHILANASNLALMTRLYKDSEIFSDFNECFIPLASWNNADGTTLITKKDSSIKSFDDLFKEGKNRSLKVGLSAGYGSTHHAVALAVAKELGLQFKYVPYQGSNEVVVAVRNGEVEVGACGALIDALDPAFLNCLAISTPGRIERLPDTPTLTELGYPDFEFPFSIGGWVKAGTPEVIIDILEKALEEAFYSKGYQDWAINSKIPVGDFYGRAKWTETLAKWDDAVKGIMPDVIESMKEAQK